MKKFRLKVMLRDSPYEHLYGVKQIEAGLGASLDVLLWTLYLDDRALQRFTSAGLSRSFSALGPNKRHVYFVRTGSRDRVFGKAGCR